MSNKHILDYAVSVIRSCALPNIADDQKIDSETNFICNVSMRLNEDIKSVESARVIGNVLGKYHPHGDYATYDEMIRMTQTFFTIPFN